MSSAQVLPSSRKQELQEAGRRKLEEFRKKKAAKKASSNNQNQRADSKTERPSPSASDGVVRLKSNGPVGGTHTSQENVEDSSSVANVNASSQEDIGGSSERVRIEHKSLGNKSDSSSGALDGLYLHSGHEATDSFNDDSKSHANVSDNIMVAESQVGQKFNSGLHGLENSGSSPDGSVGISSESYWKAAGNTSFPLFMSRDSDGIGYSSYKDSEKERYLSTEHKNFDIQKPINGPYGNFDSSTRSSERAALSSDVRDSSSFSSSQNETSFRKTRPSFLDSINVPKVSSGSHFSELEKLSYVSSAAHSNGVADINFQNSSLEVNDHKMLENSENALSFFSNGPRSANDVFLPLKHNEDFAALEQHIEDLTQEKFSLHRALEASRALAESLAGENSSLTESYNQQRQNLNQLKADMEALQEEIRAQMVELESLRNGYDNARLECDAAEERARILAAEVIGLEEKALRLRSQELKLEKELENSQAEMSSYKKRLSSLERERQDMQLTINALQEEKTVLQSKLRKASSGGKAAEVIATTIQKEMSTSTEDLESTHQESEGNSAAVSSNVQPTVEGLTMNIPSEQMRVIQNIEMLISELAVEKEELTEALSHELSQSAKLKELNKELSRKLEAQTQRLELLTSQTMVNDGTQPIKQPDVNSSEDIGVYADEGDEVVERVLGWIMKLFPGGPSRRRTSKLL